MKKFYKEVKKLLVDINGNLPTYNMRNIKGEADRQIAMRLRVVEEEIIMIMRNRTYTSKNHRKYDDEEQTLVSLIDYKDYANEKITPSLLVDLALRVMGKILGIQEFLDNLARMSVQKEVSATEVSNTENIETNVEVVNDNKTKELPN